MTETCRLKNVVIFIQTICLQFPPFVTWMIVKRATKSVHFNVQLYRRTIIHSILMQFLKPTTQYYPLLNILHLRPSLKKFQVCPRQFPCRHVITSAKFEYFKYLQLRIFYFSILLKVRLVYRYSQEKTVYYSIDYKNGYLSVSDFFNCLHNQLSSIYSIIMYR